MANDEVTGVIEEEQSAPVAEDQQKEQEADGDSQQPQASAQPSPQPPSPITQDLADAVPDAQNLEMLLDVNLKVTVELGRARMKFRDVLNLSTGTIVELTKQTSEPVDILVNGALLASGEVVVMDDHFAVRINKLLNRVERLKRII